MKLYPEAIKCLQYKKLNLIHSSWLPIFFFSINFIVQFYLFMTNEPQCIIQAIDNQVFSIETYTCSTFHEAFTIQKTITISPRAPHFVIEMKEKRTPHRAISDLYMQNLFQRKCD